MIMTEVARGALKDATIDETKDVMRNERIMLQKKKRLLRPGITMAMPSQEKK